MALFKILRGSSDDFNLANMPFHDGYCYFTTDNGMFYIDYEKDGQQNRIPLNASDATTLAGASLQHSQLNNSEIEIPSSALLYLVKNTLENYVNNQLATKSAVQMTTTDSSKFLPTLNIHKMTQDEYNQAFNDGSIDSETLYLIPDEEIDLSNYVTIEQLETKADVEHNHDDKYYTETEIDAKFASIPIPDVSDQIESHNSSTTAHDDIRNMIAQVISDMASQDNIILTSAQEYTNTAVAQKAQIQMITWEADD